MGVENHEAVQEGFEEISEQARQDGQSFIVKKKWFANYTNEI